MLGSEKDFFMIKYEYYVVLINVKEVSETV